MYFHIVEPLASVQKDGNLTGDALMATDTSRHGNAMSCAHIHRTMSIESLWIKPREMCAMGW